MKIYSSCKIKKTKDNFIKDSQSKDGLKGSCKDCTRAYDNFWYAANAEKRKFWALNNPERAAEKATKKRETSRTWEAANPEKRKKISKSWRLKNVDKLLCNNAKHQAKKLRATPSWAESEKEEIKKLYKIAKLKTKETGIKYHVDHIVPLNSKIVQGFHCLANLQILDAKTNMVKSNRVWPDMPLD